MNTTANPTSQVGLAFVLNCVPPKANHQRKKIVRFKLADGRQITKLGDRDELVAAKDMLESLLLPHQPNAAICGPVTIELEFTWPWLGMHRQRIRALGRVPHTSTPDVDNVAKTLIDRLAKLRFIEKDQCVVELRARKFWGERPGIAVRIVPCAVGLPLAPSPLTTTV